MWKGIKKQISGAVREIIAICLLLFVMASLLWVGLNEISEARSRRAHFGYPTIAGR